MSEKVCLIVNPLAGKGLNKKARRLFGTAIRKNRGLLVFTEPEGENTANELAKRAQEKGFKRIGVAGGDGTISQVVKGLSLPDPSISVGIIPTGRANDLASALCLPKRVKVALNLLINGENTIPIDLGIVNNRPFISTFGVGLDAEMDKLVSTDCSRLRKMFFWRSIFCLWRLPFIKAFFDQIAHCVPYLELILSGDIERRSSTVLLTVNNLDRYGSIFKMTPEAKIDDGLLDVCLITAPISRRAMITLCFEAMKGNHTRFPQVSVHQIRHLVIESDRAVIAQVDGELIDPAIRFEVSVFPKALNAITPLALIPAYENISRTNKEITDLIKEHQLA